MLNAKCPFCNNNVKEFPIMGDDSHIVVECPECGDFIIWRNMEWLLPRAIGKVVHEDEYYYGSEDKKDEYNKQLFILSSYLSQYSDSTGKLPEVDEGFIKMVLKSSEIPRTPEDKIESILKYIHNKTSYFGEFIHVSCRVIFSNNEKELGFLIRELVEEGYLKQRKDGPPYQKNGEDDYVFYSIIPLSITLKGIRFIRDKKLIQGKEKCFVAMWFDSGMDKVWEEAIKPACEETGYNPIRVDKEQFNDDINDHIISGIKEAYFVIADLTGFRGGVYYEAGFARGLEKEVILCCKDGYEVKIKYAGSRKLKPEKGPHFDVNHLKTIYWKDDDLPAFKQSLKERILATVERGTYDFQDSKK